MELLTDRLAALMKQVADNQIAELVNKDRLQKQRLVERSQRTKMMSYQTVGVLNRPKQFRRPILSFQKKEEPKVVINQAAHTNVGERPTEPKIATIGSIWGISKKAKDNLPTGGNIGEKPKRTEKEAAPLNKFRKVAQMTVLINSIKQGRDICTCESLDAKCKIHDN